MTALGRFHRYVAKGLAGAHQQFWSDDCMNQLGTAVEIALSQDWADMAEALTGIARVLQSYENAGRAQSCAPFLTESYEILSAMVGDLLVHKTHSVAIERWRDRYRRAVGELRIAGVTLVEDEEIPVATSVPDAASEPLEAPKSGAADASGPALDSFLPLFDTADENERGAEEAPAGAEAATPVMTPAPAGVTDAESVATEVVGILDSLCEDFAQLDKGAEAGRTDRFSWIGEKVAALEADAREKGQEAPQEVCRRMGELCRLASSVQDAAFVNEFLDIVYGFCEAFVEAGRDPASESVGNWNTETAALVEKWRAPVVPEEAPPVPETPPEGSPESLLETAQQAVIRGDMAGAKALALQAVAQLAQNELARAEVRVQEAEVRFRESGEAIERARGNVKRAEQEVVAADGRVAEGDAGLREARSSVTSGSEKLSTVEKRIAEIDEQIRVLQALRATEEQRAHETSAAYDQAHQEEMSCEKELATLQEAEDHARARLEDARQTVKDLQRRRTELEAALSRSRETLARHRASLADIERTIGQLSTGDETPPDTENLLF
jgi:predicted  nucleic acid-binding Zn-ribbon protein